MKEVKDGVLDKHLAEFVADPKRRFRRMVLPTIAVHMRKDGSVENRAEHVYVLLVRDEDLARAVGDFIDDFDKRN